MCPCFNYSGDQEIGRGQDKHNPLTTWIFPCEFSILYIVAIDIVEKDSRTTERACVFPYGIYGFTCAAQI
jgi:hypothetical protein